MDQPVPVPNEAVTFFRVVGKLCYAVAATDGYVHPDEFSRLKEVVSQYWVPVEEAEDPFHSRAAYQMEILFDWLNENPLPAQECLDEFLDYLDRHPSQFTLERRKLIARTADAIAASFSGKNKSELIILTRINLALFH
jgi:hypothetical protein